MVLYKLEQIISTQLGIFCRHHCIYCVIFALQYSDCFECVRAHFAGTRQNVEQICGADQNGDNLQISWLICRSVITVVLGLWLGLALGLGLQIVVYKLLE